MDVFTIHLTNNYIVIWVGMLTEVMMMLLNTFEVYYGIRPIKGKFPTCWPGDIKKRGNRTKAITHMNSDPLIFDGCLE